MSEQEKEREKRKIMPVGLTEKKLSALEEIRRIKESGGKRSEQFQVFS